MTAASPALLVLDLDGTLVDTAGDLIDTLNVTLARENVPPFSLEDGRTMVGAGVRALIARGLDAAGRSVSPERSEELFRLYLEHYEAHIADRSALYPGVPAALDRFETAGFRFAVCTNKLEVLSVKLLEALRVADRFAAICGQDTFGIAKPDADALLKTIEKAGGNPQRTVMVGDSHTDIQTAKNAGVPVVAVDFGYTDKHVSAFGPDRVISHFDELWDAVAGLRAIEPASP